MRCEILALGVLRRLKEGVEEPEFRAFVYEHASAESGPPDPEHAMLSGMLAVHEKEIDDCETAANREAAYNSLVRVKLINLAHSFAREITPGLARERREWVFEGREPAAFPPLGDQTTPSGWFMAVWWREP